MLIPKSILSVALLAVLFAAAPARADMCTLDNAPAASLLFPYFEVGLDGSSSSTLTTRIWLRNTADRPRLAQVTVWSDWGVAITAFYVYLPASGTQRMDLADLLIDGRLPSTGAGVSPIGDFDAAGTPQNFPGCNNTSDPANGLPVTSSISPTLLSTLQTRLTGRQSPNDGLCGGQNFGDLVARGYLTVDLVASCSFSFPDSPGYPFELEHENSLVGGFELLDPINNFAQGGRAVALQSNTSDVLLLGDISFYGRYHAAIAVDQREPLPPTWHVEFDDSSGLNSDSAELIVWRGVPITNPRACGSVPQWFPMGDSGRRPYSASGDTPADPILFPGDPAPFPEPFALATGRYPASQLSDTLQGTVSAGSAELLLLTISNLYPTFEEGQSWVGVVHNSEGRFSEIKPGKPLDSFCEFVQPQPADVSGPPAENPNTLTYLFSDDFEP